MSHASSSSVATTTAQTVLRVALGGVLVAHGSQRLFGWFGGGGIEGTSKGMHAMGFRPAKLSAVLAGLGEAGAGLALALGLATPAAGAAATTMGVAASVPAAIGVQIYRRCKALAADATSAASVTPVEEGSTDPARRSHDHDAVRGDQLEESAVEVCAHLLASRRGHRNLPLVSV
ncbi:DoxX family membrane protein [Paenarthrobacter sp. PH39-S1]|uniref:DoxX family membrane protein n=1 Tax=Paenarthrobacter sp. PH39-S1 TaxID=3046204 RepID=UPI0024B97678|nr:DoxX family membrane protein [Paenarthrobacter sp. PH39-S1]MDJ0355220.1 DoxX family membrane protein [Paenarthrobacter sp. PH39-S1]